MTFEVRASVREAQGTGASRRLRRAGQTPAVIYGDNQEPLAIAVDANALFHALNKEAFHSSILKVELDGKKIDVIVRDFQMHPFKPAVQHIDFQTIDLAKPVTVKVPLHLINVETSPAVKLHGGRISKLMSTVEVITSPASIPQFLELDMSKVVGGQILHISDVTMPEGCESVSLRREENLAVASATGKKR